MAPDQPERLMITEKEPALSAQDQADATQDVISREDILLAQLKDMTVQKADLERRLHDRVHEIVLLTRIIRDLEATIARDRKRLEWFRQVLIIFTKRYSRSRKGWLMKFLPSHFTFKNIKLSLKRRNLFDDSLYTKIYPDVMAHNIDPLRHYILHGVNEGRIISRDTPHD